MARPLRRDLFCGFVVRSRLAFQLIAQKKRTVQTILQLQNVKGGGGHRVPERRVQLPQQKASQGSQESQYQASV